MSAAETLREAARVIVPESLTEDGGDHFACHCNPDVSWCQLNMADCEWVDDDSDVDCPLCGLVSDEMPHCCPWGCTCEEC